MLAVELKSDKFNLPVLYLRDADLEPVAELLGQKVKQLPDFFKNIPLVIDLSGVPGDSVPEMPELLELLRGYGILPLGLRGASSWQVVAEQYHLAYLREHVASAQRAVSDPEPGPAPAQPVAPPPESPPDGGTVYAGGLIVQQPVRSGQRVYSRGGDLVVLGMVSSGAEVLSEGNIHIYGQLRGRALAGVTGNEQCRIFCRELRADLVAIAGQYRVNEHLPQNMAGQWTQVYLHNGSMMIEAI